MAKLFRYFDDWKTEVFTCPVCGWKGTFDEGDVELYQEVMDSSCPECDWFSAPMLAIVSWPTKEECEQNQDKMSEIDQMSFLIRKRFLEKMEQTSLKSAAELPEIEGSAIVISWDFEEGKPHNYTVLLRAGVEIWREPAVYEGYERFGEIVDILKTKYGERLVDVVPTKASQLYLYGDEFGAPRAVDSVRSGIQS